MGSKRSRNHGQTNNQQDLAVPPGFLSRTSFTLRLSQAEQEDASPMGVVDRPEPMTGSDEKIFGAFLARSPFSWQEQLNQAGRTEDDPTHYCPSNGEIQRCPICEDCMEVTAKQPHKSSHLLKIDDAPVFQPSEEEFKDTLKYIARICRVAESYGICRIVPPTSWRPPCFLEDKMMWEPGPVSMSPRYEHGSEFTLKSFKRQADDVKMKYFSSMSSELMETDNSVDKVPGHPGGSIEKIEAAYWRLIENDEETEGLRRPFPVKPSSSENSAENSESAAFRGSLSNIPNSPGSLLPFGCYSTSTTSVPRLFLEMCFTSQFWKNEDHHLYYLSYMHLGEPKVWYSVPGRYCFKFVEVVKKKFPQLSAHPNLLQELATQIPPSTLIYEGIPVYKCVQRPSELVLVFPGAYRTEISSGFNCSESTCFAPFDWLPHGQNIIEHYAEYGVKCSLSHDKLLVGAATRAVTAEWEYLTKKDVSLHIQMFRNITGKSGLLTKLLKCRVKTEGIWRNHGSRLLESKAFDDHDEPVRRECCICHYDLYLSAVSCSCSPNRYSCLRHSKRLCSCAWISRVFLYRYTMPELELLVQAVEGNLTAILKWIKQKDTACGSGKPLTVSSSTPPQGVVILSDGED